MKYIITALATALFGSFLFISYQHFVIISKLQDEKKEIKRSSDSVIKEIKRSSDSVILVITERPTYSSSVETTTNVEKAKGSVLNLEQANKAEQKNKVKNK